MEGNAEMPPNRLAGKDGFQDQTLLVTGGSGFVGKALIEKVLRTCPLVKKIYVMIRLKKGKDSRERMNEILNGPLFDLLRKTRGADILKKVVPIPSDISEPNLGLSEENRQLLTEETDMIFHVAATVRFDEPLKPAVLLNTRATKLMLELAKACKKLSAFVHVSTTYCFHQEKVLYEKTYIPPANPHEIIRIVEYLDERSVEKISDKLIGNYPNTYTFTKALSEGLVNEEMENLPIIIVRVSIVVPVWKDPLPGWTDNINGPTGLLIAAGKGVLRSMYIKKTGYADFIPVDLVANAIMVSAYDYKVYKQRRVFHSATSSSLKITWGEIIDFGKQVVTTTTPFNGGMWYPGGRMTQSRLIHNVRAILFHYFPALILDMLIFLSGNKPVLWRIHTRISKAFDVLEFFTNNQWDFNNEQMMKTREWMNETEKDVYKWITPDIDFDFLDYFTKCCHALRLYILNESDETIPAAKRHIKMLWVLDRVSKFIILPYLSYLLLSSFIYFIFHIML